MGMILSRLGVVYIFSDNRMKQREGLYDKAEPTEMFCLRP